MHACSPPLRAVPKWGHCHCGIMSGLPTSRNYETRPPLTPHQTGGHPSPPPFHARTMPFSKGAHVPRPPLVLTQACPNTAALCFRTFAPVLEPLFLQFQSKWRTWFVALCQLREGSMWVSECWCSGNSLCSCVLGCLLDALLIPDRLSQHVFRGTCHVVTRACPNTATPCFRTFTP